MKGITEDTLFEKIDVMINTLMQYFSIKENNEKSKTQILEQLNKYLAHKKYKKLHPTLFIVKEFLCSTEDLTTLEKEAPRAVIYTSDREEAFIAAAYIVADELKVKIPQPTVPKVIAGLLSAYFVWHVEYPISYANILEYIQHEILTTSLKSRSTVVMKFIRDCDNLKASLTT